MIFALLLATVAADAPPRPRAELHPGARYDAGIPSLQQVAGHDFGDEISTPEQISAYLRALSAAAPGRTSGWAERRFSTRARCGAGCAWAAAAPPSDRLRTPVTAPPDGLPLPFSDTVIRLRWRAGQPRFRGARTVAQACRCVNSNDTRS